MKQILNRKDVWLMLKDHTSFDQEEVWCVALNSESHNLGTRMIFRGTVNACLFHPRDVFRFLILKNSSQFIMIHTHPSGNPEPSPNDIEITERLFYLSQLMEIPLRDHLIFASNKSLSFKENGYFEKFENELRKKISLTEGFDPDCETTADSDSF